MCEHCKCLCGHSVDVHIEIEESNGEEVPCLYCDCKRYSDRSLIIEA